MVAVVGAAGVYVPQAVAENVAATGKECAITVESGTVKWGIKQSWRSYILGNIAHGTWKTSGQNQDYRQRWQSYFFRDSYPGFFHCLYRT
ncbi:HtaA domain-containing protein [Corynebacterium diphtheriae]|uniref:HtaA domain-containing protein n=1 Tax=Corynebacterium diphtheriae TaxID=1717 RepID=UPI003CC7F838